MFSSAFSLSTFLGKITRNLSFDLYRKMHRGKLHTHLTEMGFEI